MAKIIDIKTRRIVTEYQNSPAQITQERDYDTGKILSRVRVARSTIEIWSMNGTLTTDQAQAAENFRATFEASMLQPRYAKVAFDRVQFGSREWTNREIEAAQQTEKALKAIRKGAREAAWYVIGFGEKLSVYCSRLANMKQPISYNRGKRLVISALDDLVKYY